MARDCGYHRPSDGAPCVMGAMHVTKHYFAEVEPAVPAPAGAPKVPAPDPLDAEANAGDPLAGSLNPPLDS